MRQRLSIAMFGFAIALAIAATAYAQGQVFLPIAAKGWPATPTATPWWWWPTWTPTLTPTATATGTSTPTPTPTPTPMALGDTFQFEGLQHSIVSYNETDTCPNGSDKADEGAKLVVLWIRSENVSNDYRDMPSLDLRLLRDGIEIGKDAGGCSPCCYDSRTWGNACWPGLWPGVACEGWEVWAVPEATQVQGLVAEGQFRDWQGTEAIAGWRLGH